MTSRVFLDTSYIVALINQNDQYHKQALGLSEKYEYEPLITTNVILIEIGNALSRKYRQQAIDIIQAIRSSDEVILVELDSILLEKAFDMYKQYEDKTWGMVDCISFIVMNEKGIREALSFDTDFEQAGFKLLLPQT